jgi:hypothetical protein
VHTHHIAVCTLRTCKDDEEELAKDENSILYAISSRFFTVDLEYMDSNSPLSLRPTAKKTRRNQRAEKLRMMTDHHVGPPLFVQLLNIRSKSHILWQALPRVAPLDMQVICMREMKMSLLARSCVCPGSLTLITNLLSTFDSPSR